MFVIETLGTDDEVAVSALTDFIFARFEEDWEARSRCKGRRQWLSAFSRFSWALNAAHGGK